MSNGTSVKFNYNIQINIEGYQDHCKPRKNITRRQLFRDKHCSVYVRTKEILSKAITKFTKSISDLKATVWNATQYCSISVINDCKKSESENYDMVSCTFQTPSRALRGMLGRTPIKLYSPFGIETPS